jgi:hypothetical protein
VEPCRSSLILPAPDAADAMGRSSRSAATCRYLHMHLYSATKFAERAQHRGVVGLRSVSVGQHQRAGDEQQERAVAKLVRRRAPAVLDLDSGMDSGRMTLQSGGVVRGCCVLQRHVLALDMLAVVPKSI